MVLVPYAPPSPAFVQQMALVLSSMSADGVLAPVTPLENTESHYITVKQPHHFQHRAFEDKLSVRPDMEKLVKVCA